MLFLLCASSKEVRQIVSGEISVYGSHQISETAQRSETLHDWNVIKCCNLCPERLDSGSYEGKNFHMNSDV